MLTRGVGGKIVVIIVGIVVEGAGRYEFKIDGVAKLAIEIMFEGLGIECPSIVGADDVIEVFVEEDVARNANRLGGKDVDDIRAGSRLRVNAKVNAAFNAAGERCGRRSLLFVLVDEGRATKSSKVSD